MRRTLTGIGLWIGAALVAVAVAFQGVNVVADQVTDERPAALAASDIEERLAAAATSTTVAPTSSSSLPTTTSTAPPATAPATTAAPTPTSSPGPVAPSTAPTTAVTQAETRTYELVGGTAVLRFGPAGVEVVFATPKPGFSVEREPEHGNGVKVEFESGSHESRVDGWWDNGPQERVREQAED